MIDKELMKRLQKMVSPELAMMGFELIDMEFSGKSLKLTIDKPSGVTLDDCVSVNRRVSLLLDAEDPIDGSYRLEVSSPGLTRRLKTSQEFVYFSGRKVKVQTSDGVIHGTIRGLEGDHVILETEGSEVTIKLVDIIKANLDF